MGHACPPKVHDLRCEHALRLNIVMHVGQIALPDTNNTGPLASNSSFILAAQLRDPPSVLVTVPHPVPICLRY